MNVTPADTYFREHPEELGARTLEIAEALASMPEPVLSGIVDRLTPTLRDAVAARLGLPDDRAWIKLRARVIAKHLAALPDTVGFGVAIYLTPTWLEVAVKDELGFRMD